MGSESNFIVLMHVGSNDLALGARQRPGTNNDDAEHAETAGSIRRRGAERLAEQ